MSLLSTWSKNNSSLYDVFRKESNNGYLYLPASGGTPLVGKLSYGSGDVGNLHDEMLVIFLKSYFIHLLHSTAIYLVLTVCKPQS